MRLNKYLARCGIGSRRKCDEFISKGGRHITKEKAHEHIADYSIFNDGSIRDWLRHTIQFCPGKNFEGTGPFGPWLMALDEFGDPYAQELTTRLNGEQVQHTSIAAMDHKIDKQIEYLSTVHTLRRGMLSARVHREG